MKKKEIRKKLKERGIYVKYVIIEILNEKYIEVEGRSGKRKYFTMDFSGSIDWGRHKLSIKNGGNYVSLDPDDGSESKLLTPDLRFEIKRVCLITDMGYYVKIRESDGTIHCFMEDKGEFARIS